MAPAGGMPKKLEEESTYQSGIQPGQFVTAQIPNTGFYKKKPNGYADADQLIEIGTQMKVITLDESYTKVELDGGEVGWVPTIMIDMPSANDISEVKTTSLPSSVDNIQALPSSTTEGIREPNTIPVIINPDENEVKNPELLPATSEKQVGDAKTQVESE